MTKYRFKILLSILVLLAFIIQTNLVANSQNVIPDQQTIPTETITVTHSEGTQQTVYEGDRIKIFNTSVNTYVLLIIIVLASFSFGFTFKPSRLKFKSDNIRWIDINESEKIRACCYQTARLGEFRCVCERTINHELISKVTTSSKPK